MLRQNITKGKPSIKSLSLMKTGTFLAPKACQGKPNVLGITVKNGTNTPFTRQYRHKK